MDLEQLQLILSMVQTVTDGAMWVLLGYVLYKVLVLTASVLCVWLVCQMILQWARVAWHENDWLDMRKRLYPHIRHSYTSEEHVMVTRALHRLIDKAEQEKLK